MVHEFEEYVGPEKSESSFTCGDIQINLELNMVYADKMVKCKHCGIKVADGKEQPKFETCEEVYVDEVMGS